MPDAPDYQTEVLAYLKEKAGEQKKPVTLESRLKEDLGFDSLDGVETVQDLEERYSLAIPDEVAQSWTQGKDIAAYLENPAGYIATHNITLAAKP